MKKILSLLLAAVLCLGLAACGESGAQPSSEPTAPASEPAATPSEEPAAAATEPAGDGSSMLETAKTFEGAALEDLIAVIGEPESSDYAPSCLGEGEDGNLYYDGFTVYTYRDTTGEETVNYVE